MSGSIEFFCGPEEFWGKMRGALSDLQLVCFKRCQTTGQIISVPLTEIDQPNEFNWDLWAGTSLPSAEFCNELPAKAGWIKIVGPKVTSEKQIEICWISAKTDWLDHESRQILNNDDLSRLFEKLRRRLYKGTITSSTAIEFSNGVTRNFPIRYTAGALALQRQNWVFIRSGAIHRLPEE